MPTRLVSSRRWAGLPGSSRSRLIPYHPRHKPWSPSNRCDGGPSRISEPHGCSGQRWPDEFDPVLTARLGQSFSLLRGGRPGRVRQSVAFRWTAKGPDKALELPPARDGQKARAFSRLDPVSVWRALRDEQDVPDRGPLLALTNLEPHLSRKNPEHVILTAVRV